MIYFTELWQYADNISAIYNLSATRFVVIYLASIPPFYFGYFLMIYGSTREMQWRDIFRFQLQKLKWNYEFKAGLIIHIIGRIMPYAYILFFSENLPLFIYLIIFVALFLPFSYFVRKIYIGLKILKNRSSNSILVKKEIIEDINEMDKLWEIYHNAFSKLNKRSPCKQSFDREHFIDVLKNPTALKYIITDKDNNNFIALALITNNLKNSPWISEEYFESKFPDHFSKGLIYYFMGLAIHDDYKRQGHSLNLIEMIIDDLPHEAIMGFDHSYNINPILHYFTSIVKQAKFIKRKHLDKQSYHIVHRR